MGQPREAGWGGAHLEHIVVGLVEEREHLRVIDAATGGHPLHVAVTEAPSIAERVRVVDDTAARHRDGLKAAMRVLRKARHRLSMVHGPPRRIAKVGTNRVSAEQPWIWTHVFAAGRIPIVVVHGEEKRRVAGKGKGELGRAQDGRRHILYVDVMSEDVRPRTEAEPRKVYNRSSRAEPRERDS